MGYRRPSQKQEWAQWLRHHRNELVHCGIPADAYRSELDWYLFLDHGYVQSSKTHTSQWWNIRLLTPEQAERLRAFLIREYADGYQDLIQTLGSYTGDG
jgi:hypothetical protein